MKLIGTTPARGDLDRIWTFNTSRDHANKNDGRAAHIEDTLIDAAAGLLAAPRQGRPGEIDGTRELSLTAIQYLLVYAVDADAVTILRVWSTAERRG